METFPRSSVSSWSSTTSHCRRLQRKNRQGRRNEHRRSSCGNEVWNRGCHRRDRDCRGRFVAAGASGGDRSQPKGSTINIPFEEYKLPNGLRVILSPDRTTPTVAVNVWYHVGSKNEEVGRTGFAHLFEHVMFTGSGNVAYGTHDKYTEGVGGSNNGTTDNDRTLYYETIPSNFLENSLWLESDRMGFLLDALDIAKLNAQRDIVKIG